jgi:outer membrane protein
MMPRLLRRFLNLVVLIGIASAHSLRGQEEAPVGDEKLRVASVDLQELFADYPKTRLSEREISSERARIAKVSQRAGDEIRQHRKLLQEHELRMESKTVSAEEKAQIAREKPILEREIALLTQKQKEERNQAASRLNQQMEARMNGILREITQRAARYAKEEGYHLLYDSSGTNSVQVPPILVSSHAVDITSELAADFAKGQKSKKD